MSGSDRLAPDCPLPAVARDHIELGHGSGGLMTHRLIEGLFRPAFAADASELSHDGAICEIDGARLAFSTDSYVVRPLFFPGGDIGSLAVYGTVNDLAMCGAEPRVLSVGLVLEEGFAIAQLQRVIESMADAARRAGVRLVTGDTKVVEHGKGDGLYINTSGVGRVVSRSAIAPRQVRPGDAIVLSGDIGRHGVAIMAAREGLGFETDIQSDCGPLVEPVRELMAAGIELHCLRDLTRGGLATALIEIAEAGRVSMRLVDSTIGVSEPVRGACEILGLDPLYVANEGRFIAIVAADEAERTVAILRRFDEHAAVIGQAEAPGDEPAVHLGTLGGSRVLDRLAGEQLPRIC